VRWLVSRTRAGHLRRHDTTADDYRALVGLNPSLPLTAPSMCQLRARQLRKRIETDERIRAGMGRGAALARSGLLQARAREVASRRPMRPRREQTLVEDGRQLGRERARAFRERRELRSRSSTSMAWRTICVGDTSCSASGSTISHLSSA
jgi:hypothetical protein